MPRSGLFLRPVARALQCKDSGDATVAFWPYMVRPGLPDSGPVLRTPASGLLFFRSELFFVVASALAGGVQSDDGFN